MERRIYAWSGKGRLWTGLILLLIGFAALLKAMMLPLPEWLFSWPLLLIVIGLFAGARNRFTGSFWFIMILVGGVFLVDHYFPDLIMKTFLWPLALIALGFFFILRPRRLQEQYRQQDTGRDTYYGSDETVFGGGSARVSESDYIDATNIFGGSKRNIISKNFKGGDITNIFGGAEIDLTQADIQGTVLMDLTQIFGGMKLIVPSHWQIKVEMDAFFGGVEDKRRKDMINENPEKVLVLHGTSIFGGIEVHSY